MDARSFSFFHGPGIYYAQARINRKKLAIISDLKKPIKIIVTFIAVLTLLEHSTKHKFDLY